MRRLLIANRGEIAARIAHTARYMGIETVGVYSEPDRKASHVDHMDRVFALGTLDGASDQHAGPASGDASGATIGSYTDVDKLIEIALRSGADAIHPGYGFLAENAAAAQRFIDAGLIWVGPTPANIALLGDKLAAKNAAIEAGVPTTRSVRVTPDELPDDLTAPVLVKAAAGGGGRGMRVVHDLAELSEAVASASREAAANFGDPTVFVEPYIERGRHVEVQIFGDAHGNVVHLGERECSIQRRNQKVIEESPSPGIDDETRQALLAGAVALGRAVGYQNAGTVEFIVGVDGTITFLEVNTRLQVEHRVTEMVTLVDLVRWQIEVARGEPLPLEQDEIEIYGHGIELRVVAENPAAGWMPSTGTIRVLNLPTAGVDTALRAGSSVSVHYDSLIAKIYASGDDRNEAIGDLRSALAQTLIDGVETNLAMLGAVLEEPDFLAGKTLTSYLDDHPEVSQALPADSETRDALLIGAALARRANDRAVDGALGFAPANWRNLRTQGERSTWNSGDIVQMVEIMPGAANPLSPFGSSGSSGSSGPDDAHDRVALGPWPAPLDSGALGVDERIWRDVVSFWDGDTLIVIVDGRRWAMTVAVDGRRVLVRSRTGSMTWVRTPDFVQPEVSLGGGGPICPLPGTVLSVDVTEGDTVEADQVLMVVEAMKMEHRITAAAPSMVTEVHFAVGDRVDSGDLLVSLEPLTGHAE